MAKNQNWAKQKNIPLEIPPMMLETSKKVVELIQVTLRAGMNITANGPFLVPIAPRGRLKKRNTSKLAQTKKYASRNTPNDA